MTGIALIILACFLWALDALIRYPLVNEGFDSVSLVLIEHGILFILSSYIGIATLKKIKQQGFKSLGYFLVVGALGSALATVTFTRAFSFLNPSLVIILQKFQPIVAIMLAKFFLKENLSKQFLKWAFVCVFGALMISWSDLQTIFTAQKLAYSDSAVMGYILVLISVIGWGSATVFGKKLTMTGFSETEVMSGRFIFGFLVLLPFWNAEYINFDALSDDIYKIAVMVMISGILAMYLYYLGLKRVSARACALAEMFFPFAAVVVNWIFLDAKLNGPQIVGGLILLLGSSVIQVKKY